MTNGAHRSIGEVLDLLKSEFPDVTVSKIRFLESQGLIAPERTPSGYRKFYSPDVERLRWILSQQRDHFLPLKVIKSRLTQLEENDAMGGSGDPEMAAMAADAPGPVKAQPGAAVTAEVTGPAPAPSPSGAASPSPAASASGANGEGAALTSGAALSREELARSTGLDPKVLDELESYGLLPPPMISGDEAIYDEDALVIARLARGFLRHGVEVRHLRMYRTFAEREASFVSQLVTPILRQKNPEARRNARETVAELARLGGGMRAALLRVSLRSAFGE